MKEITELVFGGCCGFPQQPLVFSVQRFLSNLNAMIKFTIILHPLKQNETFLLLS